MSNNQENAEQGWGWGILPLVALIIAGGLLVPPRLGTLVIGPGGGLALTWLVVAILMLIIIGIIGVSLNKGLLGILIDNRNMMSLSRLQIVLWTVVILSAFVTVALARVSDSSFNPGGYVCEPTETTEKKTEQEPECADPLGIQLPALLWALMGISVTSAVGSPLLKAAKAQRTEGEDRRWKRAAETRRKKGETVVAVTYGNVLKEVTRDWPREVPKPKNEGAIAKKNHWSDARFSDVFMGEEVSNFMYVDVAKVQNFFFTMISVVGYTVALAVAMSKATSIAEFFAFPDLPAGLIALLSISHGGYLTDKAFTHSVPTELPES